MKKQNIHAKAQSRKGSAEKSYASFYIFV